MLYEINLLKEQGMEQIGVVLAYPTQGDKDIAIVVHSSVRWLTRDEFRELLHPMSKPSP